MRAREIERDSPRGYAAAQYANGRQHLGAAEGEGEEAAAEGEDTEREGQAPELARETAAEALQLLGTGYSPVVRPLSAPVAPYQQETPKSLMPIPASLRAGSAEPKQLGERARGGGAAQGRRGQPKQRRRQQQAGTSEDSGWRCCGICGLRLDARPPWAARHGHQHLQRTAVDIHSGKLYHLACATAGLSRWACCRCHAKNPKLAGGAGGGHVN